MKLELKHIAPYLPYGLMVKYQKIHDMEFEVIAMTQRNNNLCMVSAYPDMGDFSSDSYMYIDGYFLRPVLRPLSSITKEEAKELLELAHGFNANNKTVRVVISGERVIILYEFINGVFLLASLSYTNKTFIIDIYTRYGSIKKTIPTPISVYEWLFEHHFDVFNLIGQKLAIDKTEQL